MEKTSLFERGCIINWFGAGDGSLEEDNAR